MNNLKTRFFRFILLFSRTASILLFGLVITSCSSRPHPIPEETDQYWYGNIASGEKFGVNIGDDYASAKDVLGNGGFRSDGKVSCSKDTVVGIPECSEPHEAGMFLLNRFGKVGSVYLVMDDEVVVQIVWSFAVIGLP